MIEVSATFPAGVELAAFADELGAAAGLASAPPLTLRPAEDGGPLVVVVGAGLEDDPQLDPELVQLVAAAHVPPPPPLGSAARLVADLEAAPPGDAGALRAAVLAWARAQVDA